MALITTTKCRPQTEQANANSGYTHRFDFSWRTLNGLVIGTNTAQNFRIGIVAAGDQLVQAHLHLTTAFKVAADAAFNSITFDFGDTGSATRYFSGVQINANGSFVVDSYLGPASAFIYTAASNLVVNFNSMAAKDLTNLDTGKGYLEFELLRHSDLLKNPTIY